MDMAHSFTPAPDNGRLLRDAFGRFATGVTIVTACGPEGCVAITANSFSSVSMEPPLVLWSPALSSSRYAHFAEAEHYAIHVLSAEQQDLAWKVAKNGAALVGARMDQSPEGVPILSDCLARFDCARHAVHEAGDHALVLGRVLRATVADGDPLAFFGGKVARVVTH